MVVKFTGNQYYRQSLLPADKVNLNLNMDSVNGGPVLTADHFTGVPNVQS